MNCEKCGNELFLDRKSVTDLEAIGCVGGRFYCVTGCTSIWLKRSKREPLDLSIIPTLDDVGWNGGRKVKKRECQPRQSRRVACEFKKCDISFLTRANNVKYCLLHSIIMKRERDRKSEQKRSRTLAE